MKFINKCNAVFDVQDLEQAVIAKCHSTGKKVRENYIISDREGYASICIAHEHYRIHRLLGQYYYGDAEIIHHKDGNKMNDLKENLIPMTSSEHTRQHELVKFVPDEHKRSFGMRMANRLARNDVTKDVVIALRNKGLSYAEIAKKLNCGYNTVLRRLGCQRIDWEEDET